MITHSNLHCMFIYPVMLFYGKKAIPRSTNVEFVLLNIFYSIETYLNSSSLKPINPFKRNVPCMVLYNIYVMDGKV